MFYMGRKQPSERQSGVTSINALSSSSLLNVSENDFSYTYHSSNCLLVYEIGYYDLVQ